MTEPLPQLARRTRERLTALLAEDDPDAAAWVEAVRAARPAEPVVVLVGETGRGKSSLLNALVAVPGLSPVDAGAATASWVVVRHGDQERVTAHAPGADPVEVPTGDGLGAAVAAALAADPPPRSVEVTAPVPILERLTLVDTPGAGGLVAAHAELAAEAAAGATALLVVLDAGAPLTRDELAYVQWLGGRVETVLLALTKTDLHRGWREVLAADRELLARHAPRFADAPVHPVAPRLFEAAAGAPPQVAAALRERSGIAALQAELQRAVAGRARMLGEANALRALATALDGAVDRLAASERALRAAPEAATALRARRAELDAERRTSTRGWQLRLRGEVQRARVESTHDVAGQVRAAQTRLRALIDAADRAGLEAVPREVDATLQAVAGRVAAALAERVGRVADTALAELFAPGELAAVRADLARRPRPPVVLRPPPPRPGTAEDKLLVVVGVSGGIGAGRVAALPLAGLGTALGVGAGLLVVPVTIALGLGAGWWMARTRKHAGDRAHLRQWLADVLAETRSTLDQAVAEAVIDVEEQLAIALDDALARRAQALDEELREIDAALRLDAADRSARLAEVRSRLDGLRTGRAQVDELLRRIAALRDRA